VDICLGVSDPLVQLFQLWTGEREGRLGVGALVVEGSLLKLSD
jgi:hypothetical protein